MLTKQDMEAARDRMKARAESVRSPMEAVQVVDDHMRDLGLDPEVVERIQSECADHVMRAAGDQMMAVGFAAGISYGMTLLLEALSGQEAT